MGYHRAGFDVVGVDLKPQPHYPFEFHRGDAMTWPLEGFDAIHASPPCQGYSRTRHLPWLRDREPPPLLVRPLAERLWATTAALWVIENVEDAWRNPDGTVEMPYSTVLCGQNLGVPVYRHRRFLSSFLILAPPHRKHDRTISPGRTFGGRGRMSSWERGIRMPEAMGCPWMTQHEVSQAIPPAYTEFIGRQLIEQIEAAA